jgi:hypothetical protein
MKQFSKFIPYLVIVGLVLILLYQEGCFGEPKKGKEIEIDGKKYEVVKHEIDTFYEVKTQTLYKKGKDIVHEVEVVKEIPANVDTGAILKDYYARVFYKDTFKLKDTLGFIVINDTISKNRVQNRKFYSSINVPVVKEKIYLKEISNSWFLGPSASLGNPAFLGGEIHLKSKKDVLFGAGLGLNSNLSPSIRMSVGWKINK